MNFMLDDFASAGSIKLALSRKVIVTKGKEFTGVAREESFSSSTAHWRRNNSRLLQATAVSSPMAREGNLANSFPGSTFSFSKSSLTNVVPSKKESNHSRMPSRVECGGRVKAGRSALVKSMKDKDNQIAIMTAHVCETPRLSHIWKMPNIEFFVHPASKWNFVEL
jgi:hypothetical protein